MIVDVVLVHIAGIFTSKWTSQAQLQQVVWQSVSAAKFKQTHILSNWLVRCLCVQSITH